MNTDRRAGITIIVLILLLAATVIFAVDAGRELQDKLKAKEAIIEDLLDADSVPVGEVPDDIWVEITPDDTLTEYMKFIDSLYKENHYIAGYDTVDFVQKVTRVPVPMTFGDTIEVIEWWPILEPRWEPYIRPKYTKEQHEAILFYTDTLYPVLRERYEKEQADEQAFMKWLEESLRTIEAYSDDDTTGESDVWKVDTTISAQPEWADSLFPEVIK